MNRVPLFTRTTNEKSNPGHKKRQLKRTRSEGDQVLVGCGTSIEDEGDDSDENDREQNHIPLSLDHTRSFGLHLSARIDVLKNGKSITRKCSSD